VAAGTYTSVQTVTISSSTSAATIIYTTDGSTPSEVGGVLQGTSKSLSNGGNVTIYANTTLQAFAYESGVTDSSVTSAVYTVNLPTLSAPTLNLAAGSYLTPQTEVITYSGPGTVYYTTDGTTPGYQANGTINGTAYTSGNSAFGVLSSETIQAVAVAQYYSATVASAVYTIPITGAVRYEAENATANSCAAIQQDNVGGNTGASGGYMVYGMNNTGAYLQFHVTAPASGTYRVYAYGWSPWVAGWSTQDIYVNGSEVYPTFDLFYGAVSSAESSTAFNVTLNAGANTITFNTNSTDNGNDWLDCIDVAPVSGTTVSYLLNGNMSSALPGRWVVSAGSISSSTTSSTGTPASVPYLRAAAAADLLSSPVPYLQPNTTYTFSAYAVSRGTIGSVVFYVSDEGTTWTGVSTISSTTNGVPGTLCTISFTTGASPNVTVGVQSAPGAYGICGATRSGPTVE